ncbi:MAG: hypothetical protein WC565_07075 [Parcubacteria group bacterium]
MSKLNCHWQLRANWMRRVHFSAEYVKMIDPPEDAQDIFPDKKIIGRIYMDDGTEGRYYTRGRLGAADYFERCLPLYRKARGVAIWENVNEPAVIHTTGQRESLDEFTAEWCRLCHAEGLRCVVGNFSERNPADGTIAEFVRMLSTGDYLSFHCYDAPRLGSHGYVLRYRQLIAEIRQAGLRVPPVLIGETGIDLGIVGMGRKGWQKAKGLDWGEYRDELIAYDRELCEDDEVAGAFLFTAAPTKDWRSFGITEKQARDLAERLG